MCGHTEDILDRLTPITLAICPICIGVVVHLVYNISGSWWTNIWVNLQHYWNKARKKNLCVKSFWSPAFTLSSFCRFFATNFRWFTVSDKQSIFLDDVTFCRQFICILVEWANGEHTEDVRSKKAFLEWIIKVWPSFVSDCSQLDCGDAWYSCICLFWAWINVVPVNYKFY